MVKYLIDFSMWIEILLKLLNKEKRIVLDLIPLWVTKNGLSHTDTPPTHYAVM